MFSKIIIHEGNNKSVNFILTSYGITVTEDLQLVDFHRILSSQIFVHIGESGVDFLDQSQLMQESPCHNLDSEIVHENVVAQKSAKPPRPRQKSDAPHMECGM